MKLFEVFKPLIEGRYPALDEETMKVPYEHIKRNKIHNVDELDQLVEMLLPDYPRTAGSLRFLAIRMSAMIHGEVPHGLSDKSWKVMYTDSENKNIKNFIVSQGDYSEGELYNLKQIANKHATRLSSIASKGDSKETTYAKAANIVNKFYKQGSGNTHEVLPHSKFVDLRGTLIDHVAMGWSVEKAFKELVPGLRLPEGRKIVKNTMTPEQQKEKNVEKMMGEYIKQSKPAGITPKHLYKIKQKAMAKKDLTSADIAKYFNFAKRNLL